jgi:hypothetical protein
MLIWPIDDKASELEKAVATIQTRGHEAPASRCFGSISRLQAPTPNGVDEYRWKQMKFDSAEREVRFAVEEVKEKGGGVITDMMFILSPHHRGPVPCSGLLVVIHALGQSVPVVVCTDASEVGGHHAEALSWIFDGYVGGARQAGVLPFGWVENKDWNEAITLLEQLSQKRQSQG